MTKFSYQRVATFKEIGKAYTEKNQKLTKLTYAIMKVMKSADKAIEKIGRDIQNELEEKRVELAEIDQKTQVLLSENGMYKYTKNNAKELSQFVRAKNDVSEIEVEVEPHIPVFDTSSLTVEEIFAFEGFVIPVVEEPVDIEIPIGARAN